MKLFSSQSDFAKNSKTVIHLDDYKKTLLQCIEVASHYSALESQKFRFKFENKLLQLPHKSKLGKKLQIAFLITLRFLRYLYQILTVKSLELFKFPQENNQKQMRLGTFNYGAQNQKFFGFHPDPENLLLVKHLYTLSIADRIHLFINLMSAKVVILALTKSN